MQKKIYKNTFYLLLLIFPVAFFAKIYEYNFMDDNAFVIIRYILNGVYNNILTGDKSFDFPILIFSFFKFLPIGNNIINWGIFNAIIMNIVCFIILLRNEKYTIVEYIFLYFTIFILNFTVFDINKDIVQFIVVLFIYMIFSLKKLNNKLKVIFCFTILLLESLVFREYYILTAGLFILIYIMLLGLIKQSNKQSTIAKIIFIFLFFFLAVYIMKYISYESYNQLINRRASLEYIEANTLIKNLIPGTSYGTFCINYIINLFRCMFPIELIGMGIKYIIFAIYQFYISANIIKSIKKINHLNLLWVAFILAYSMTLAASESDFGTFVRHQSVLIFFYAFLFRKNKERLEYDSEKN